MKLIITLFSFLLLAVSPLYSQTGFSQARATELLKTLSIEIGPRPMGSPAEQRALSFAVEQFKEYGCDTAYIMPMRTSSKANTTSGIAVGIKHGPAKRTIVIGGHIDSAGPEIPGADDDGSGTAVVLETARVLCQRQPQSTLVFACFGGEEEGLEGSRYFVDHFENIDSVMLMLQVDMANGLGLIDIDPDSYSGSAPQWLVRAAIEEFNALGYTGLRYPTHFFSLNYAGPQGSGSDHESFLKAGIPAVDFSTDVSNPIHTPKDNFENFDPRGLQRSGDLVLRLVNRFDPGTPGRETERYWLYLLGTMPIFVPYWGLWTFGGLSFIVGIIVFVLLRSRRIPKDSPGFMRWSALKIWITGFAVLAAGWLSSDVIGFLKGVRYPWFIEIELYIILGIISAAIAVWLFVRPASLFRVSQCPYAISRLAFILLAVYTVLCAFVSPKLIVEPASALLLISIALIVKNTFFKTIALVLAPVWMLRLVFSEWSGMVFRQFSRVIPETATASVVTNSVMILFLSFYLLPVFLGVIAVTRTSPVFGRMVSAFRSWPTFIVLAAILGILTLYLLSVPSYDTFWSRDVRVEQRYDMDTKSTSVQVRSSEFLSGMSIRHGNRDTVISGRVTEVNLDPGSFDTTWVAVNRNIVKTNTGEVTAFTSALTISCLGRPYKVTVTYSSGEQQLTSFNSHWKVINSKGIQILEWRYFPDSILSVPVEFTMEKEDSVKETIEVVFDTLASPMQIIHDTSYVIPRTTYVSTHYYR
jgi:hypothetical protein